MIGFSRITPAQLAAALATKQGANAKLDVFTQSIGTPTPAGVDFLAAETPEQQREVTGAASIDDSRFTDSRTPTAHNHDALYYTEAEVDGLIAGVSAGAPAWGAITGTLVNQTDLNNALAGKSASSHTHAPSEITGTAVVDADARLSDSRTPTAHTHAPADVTGTAVVTNDSRLSDARAPTAHGHVVGDISGLGSLATQSGTFSGTSSGVNTGDQSLAGLQPLDSDLTSIAGLSKAGNALKSLRVNAGETAYELATAGGSGTVTIVSVTTANGFSGSVATDTSTPAITISISNAATVKTTLALNNVDNTTDAGKPVSTAQQTALNLKQDAIATARVTGSNATTTGQALVDVAGLTLPLLANSVYEFEAILSVQSSSTAGCQYGVNYSTAGAAVEAQISGTLAAATSRSDRISALNTATVAYVVVAAVGAIRMQGIITTGVNAGNLTVKHLKTTSGTSTVFINSFLKARKVA